MYQSLIPALCLSMLELRLVKFWRSLQNISARLKNADNLLSENREVFYFRNYDVMYYLRRRRSSAKRDY